MTPFEIDRLQGREEPVDRVTQFGKTEPGTQRTGRGREASLTNGGEAIGLSYQGHGRGAAVHVVLDKAPT